MNYPDIITTIAQRLLESFDEVYHSAEIIQTDKGKFPAISQGDEWISLTPTDQQEILYIRRNGDDQVYDELRIGSCIKSYKMATPLRIVYFKDHAKDPGKALYKAMQSILIGGTKLSGIIQDKFRLLKDESSGDYNLGATTVYFAIDISARWDLDPQHCEEDFCVDIINPLKKVPCPAVV